MSTAVLTPPPILISLRLEVAKSYFAIAFDEHHHYYHAPIVISSVITLSTMSTVSTMSTMSTVSIMSSFCAGILSSSTNFLIYCFIGHNFRKEFLVLLRLRRKMVIKPFHKLLSPKQSQFLAL